MGRAHACKLRGSFLTTFTYLEAHVMVAKSMMESGHVIRPGNEIPYVITRLVESATKADADGDSDTKPATLGNGGYFEPGSVQLCV